MAGQGQFEFPNPDQGEQLDFDFDITREVREGYGDGRELDRDRVTPRTPLDDLRDEIEAQ